MFNTNLIPEGVDKDVAKLLIAILWLDIDIRNKIVYKEVSQGMGIKLDFDDDILGNLNECVLEMEKKGILGREYKGRHRWKLLKPVIVDKISTQEVTKEIVEECRGYFKKSYCKVSPRNGDFKDVKNALEIFCQNNPNVNITDIPITLKYLVDSRISKDPETVPNILNFINAQENETWRGKDLKYYLEEEKDEPESPFIT